MNSLLHIIGKSLHFSQPGQDVIHSLLPIPPAGWFALEYKQALLEYISEAPSTNEVEAPLFHFYMTSWNILSIKMYGPDMH